MEAHPNGSSDLSEKRRTFEIDSDERLILAAGDWHCDLVHLTSDVPEILDAHYPRGSLQPTTLLHTGDFTITNGSPSNKQFIRRASDFAFERGMRILITPGNHDSWSRLDGRNDFKGGSPAEIARGVWALPRGYRFRIGGRVVLSFGGAGSVSRPPARQGLTWWRREMPSAEEVSAAVRDGPADIVITHEAPIGGTARIDALLSGFRMKQPLDQDYTDMGRERITSLWNGVAPSVLIHGHHHEQAQGNHPDGRSVYSLASNGKAGNLIAIDVRDLAVTWLY